MIFLTLGTQLPFDRLVAALDAWCAQSGCGGQVVAQIPDPGPGGHRPRHFTATRWMAPAEYAATARAATVIVSHAGMGTIITALDLARPLIVMPRRADLGEHRNDHQIATARIATIIRSPPPGASPTGRGCMSPRRRRRSPPCSTAATRSNPATGWPRMPIRA